MIAEEFQDLNSQIDALIKDLHAEDGLQRQRARLSLIDLGHEAVVPLIEVVRHEKGTARWEAIEALSRLIAPNAVPALIGALKDDDTGIRWAASNALITQDRATMKPLLEALVKPGGFGSAVFRQGAHHILHVLKDRHRLLPKELKVLEALKGSQPEVEVPWAAEAALEDLKFQKRKTP
jgi:hypothetical protein